MSIFVKILIFLQEFWLIIPITFVFVGTKLINYLEAQNEFLKKWDPTLKILCWTIGAAITLGIISKK